MHRKINHQLILKNTTFQLIGWPVTVHPREPEDFARQGFMLPFVIKASPYFTLHKYMIFDDQQ